MERETAAAARKKERKEETVDSKLIVIEDTVHTFVERLGSVGLGS
jgi:hypothetical protein